MEKKLLKKKVLGGRKSKEKNVGEVYSSENVENYQRDLDIETILHNIENPPKKPTIVQQPLCNNPGCLHTSMHRCSRCRIASFCSRQCSVDYWPEHRADCDHSELVKHRKHNIKTHRKNSLSEVD